MTLDEQLQHTFETFTERLRGETARALATLTDELASAVAAGFALNSLLPAGTPLWAIVGGAALVFLLAYFLLGAVGGLFKLVALLAIPRIVSILIALAAVGAGILELFPNVAAGAP